ncbi:MAG: hypothetical protein WCI41_02230 [bacterium]
MVRTVLRTEKTNKKYQALKEKGHLDDGCPLCKETLILKKFKYWKILESRFPWDLISKTNHLIIPKRHTNYKGLNTLEKEELDKIKEKYINENYELMAEVPDRKKSIPKHFHIHLIVLKNKITLK